PLRLALLSTLIIFYTLLPPPSPPPFPYTTLFRSPAGPGRAGSPRCSARAPAAVPAGPPAGPAPPRTGARVPPFARPIGPARRSRDRKSTRLNSSHDQISYAVFCLKKKK